METVEREFSSTFVVGVDASEESRAAVAWARSMAGADDRIVVVHAWQLPIVTGYDMVVTGDPDEIERLAKEGLDEFVGELDDDRVVPVVRQGHAGRAIVSEADEREAAMVVVGHLGDGRVAMMLGSTASYVLHHTERPVVVVRGDGTIRPADVVVGVDDHDLDDGDNESVRALRWALQLPGVERIRVIHAWFLPALAVGMFADVAADLDVMDESARAVIDRVISAAGPVPDGVEVVAEAVRGTPTFGLIEASRETDLVVVGSRGRGGFAGLLLGSTSTAIAAHSHSPVAIVR